MGWGIKVYSCYCRYYKGNNRLRIRFPKCTGALKDFSQRLNQDVRLNVHNCIAQYTPSFWLIMWYVVNIYCLNTGQRSVNWIADWKIAQNKLFMPISATVCHDFRKILRFLCEEPDIVRLSLKSIDWSLLFLYYLFMISILTTKG